MMKHCLDTEHMLQIAYSTYCCLSDYPSKYWIGSSLLNFGDLARIGAFNVIWLQIISTSFDFAMPQIACLHDAT